MTKDQKKTILRAISIGMAYSMSAKNEINDAELMARNDEFIIETKQAYEIVDGIECND